MIHYIKNHQIEHLFLRGIIKAIAMNNEGNVVLASLTENKAEPEAIETVKQLQGLNIFISDIRVELIGKILNPLIELEKISVDADKIPSLARFSKLTDNWQEQLKQADL